MKKITLVSILFFGFTSIVFFGINLIIPSKTAQNSAQVQEENLNKIIAENTVNNSKIPSNDINPPNINIENIVYTLEESDSNFVVSEVEKHNTQEDCYIIVNNGVYDVSEYIRYHPGGPRSIIGQCGQEASSIFSKIHSNRAWDLLGKYKIGNIDNGQKDVTSQVLDAIFVSLQSENPKAEIVNVKPKDNFYIAKVILDSNLYEVHIDSQGQIIQEEVENDELNWSVWDEDSDDV